VIHTILGRRGSLDLEVLASFARGMLRLLPAPTFAETSISDDDWEEELGFKTFSILVNSIIAHPSIPSDH
jgi:hypothetical protein